MRALRLALGLACALEFCGRNQNPGAGSYIILKVDTDGDGRGAFLSAGYYMKRSALCALACGMLQVSWRRGASIKGPPHARDHVQ
jgi:hypothetical protein